MRERIKQFKNKKAIVAGRIDGVYYKSILDKYDHEKLNVKILLHDVEINGVRIDHVWLFERNKYYNIAQKNMGKRIKFKAKIESYLKRSTNGYSYKEDYGIKREGKLYNEVDYNEQKPFK